MNTSSAPVPRPYPGRLFLLLGLALPFGGIVAYMLQFLAHRLMAPWYVPCLAVLGLLFIAVSLWQARSAWRVLALLLVLLLTCAECALLLAMRLPAYTGPVAVDRPFPVFATLRADGTTFTQADLQGEQDNVMVFFRGRW